MKTQSGGAILKMKGWLVMRIIDVDELKELYQGPDNVPGQWLTIDEVAERVDLSVIEVRDLFGFYGIQERTPQVEVLKVVWDILETEWFMAWGEDFHYPAKLHHYNILFFLEADGLGFNLDPDLPANTIDTLHVHGVMIFKFSLAMDPEELAERIRKVLKDYRINKRSRGHGKSKTPGPW